MKRIPIYSNYDTSTTPVGFVEIVEDISDDVLASCAIVPSVLLDHGKPKVEEWGLIHRQKVDTSPQEQLGES